MQDKLNCYFLCKLQEKKNPPFYTITCISEEESQSFTFCQTRIRLIQSSKEKLCVWCVSLCVATPVPLSRSGSDITAALSSPHTNRPLTSLTHSILLLVKRHRTRGEGGGGVRPSRAFWFRLCAHTMLRMLLSNVKFVRGRSGASSM